MVHGRVAYMVACVPRTKGANPGSVSACARASASRRVYSGLTAMPSGVFQFNLPRSPLGADLAAAFSHGPRLEESSDFEPDMMAFSRLYRGAATSSHSTRKVLDIPVPE